MILHHTLVVHGLDQVRAALRPGRPVILLSAPGAAGFAGCLWWRGLMALGRAEFPGADLDDVLDCADSPGHAMAALRVGQLRLVLDPACPAFPAVVQAATTLGAAVLPSRPPALDLGTGRVLAAWLRGDSVSPLV